VTRNSYRRSAIGESDMIQSAANAIDEAGLFRRGQAEPTLKAMLGPLQAGQASPHGRNCSD
jgi:hypothetical protein